MIRDEEDGAESSLENALPKEEKLRIYQLFPIKRLF
jgi:hypothetical protein